MPEEYSFTKVRGGNNVDADYYKSSTKPLEKELDLKPGNPRLRHVCQ